MDLDLGKAAIERLPKLLGVETECATRQPGFCWALWGAIQCAWSEPAGIDRGYPVWKLHLRTSALTGFSNSLAQNVMLSARLTLPTLACVVQSTDRPERLELATSIEVHRGNIAWVPQMLAVAARVQAAEARMMAESKGLDWATLKPMVNTEAVIPRRLALKPEEVLLYDPCSELTGTAWPESEIAEGIDVLKLRAGAEEAGTSAGMSATLVFDAPTQSRCNLDIKINATHPLLGRGLSLALATTNVGASPKAIAMNSREVGCEGAGEVLGGWWTTHAGVLKYTGFYPDAFDRKGLAVQLLLAFARRAHSL
jgi:hypothetical protein